MPPTSSRAPPTPDTRGRGRRRVGRVRRGAALAEEVRSIASGRRADRSPPKTPLRCIIVVRGERASFRLVCRRRGEPHRASSTPPPPPPRPPPTAAKHGGGGGLFSPHDVNDENEMSRVTHSRTRTSAQDGTDSSRRPLLNRVGVPTCWFFQNSSMSTAHAVTKSAK